jgi:hypothetical protein
MSTAGVLAPELEEQPELLEPFMYVIGALVLVGLTNTLTAQHGSKSTQGWWHQILSGNPVAAAVGAISDFTRYVVSRFAAGHFHALARWLKALGTVALGVSVIKTNTQAIGNAFEDIYTHGDRVARRDATRAHTAARTAQRTASKARREANADAANLTRYKTATSAKVHHLSHAVDVALPRDIASLRERNKALERGQTRTNDAVRSLEDGAIDTFRWIRTHPLTATTGVFAGAVAVALGRLGLGGLRCNNFKNLLKHYGCGLGTLLGRLLPLAIFLGTAFDFPEFVRTAEVVANGIGEAVGKIEGTFALELPPLPPPEG